MLNVAILPYVTVPGTWGREDRWHRYDSEWATMMRAHGFVPLACDEPPRPFTWTSNLAGLNFYKRFTGTSTNTDWRTGGENLFAYLVPPVRPAARVPIEDVNIITHSHGLQCVLHAAALGLRVNSLIDVCGPVRHDMLDVARAARPNIRLWQHLYDTRRDRWQILGGIGDGVFGIVRSHPLADLNVLVENAGHTGALNDPEFFGVWSSLLDRVRLLPPLKKD